MSGAEARAARVRFEHVRAILHRDWDPIGCGVPLDEYDSYVWRVLKLVMEKATREEIELYLREAADTIASPVPEERMRLTLDRLMELAIL